MKIYKMFRILSMLDDTKIERVGDVLEWVFRSAVKVIYPTHICPNHDNDNQKLMCSQHGSQQMWNFKRRNTVQMRR